MKLSKKIIVFLCAFASIISSISYGAKKPLLVERIKGVGKSEQVITVTADSKKSIKVTIQCFEKINGKWKKIYEMPGVGGKNGFGKKIAGDKKTPVGIFTIGTAFGKYKNPGTKLPYRVTNSRDYWVGDRYSKYYNTWQVLPARGRWKNGSGEYMKRKDWLYDYGFVINYNYPKPVPGKGSGIFFHIWRKSIYGTAGCTAASKENVIKVLRWLNPKKKPLIIQGTINDVLKM